MSKVIRAIQRIYPEIETGFVYWETDQKGDALENAEKGLIWENTKFQKPKWGLIESKIKEIELEDSKAQKMLDLKSNRDAANSSSVFLVSANFEFSIKKEDSDTIRRRIRSLRLSEEQLGEWTDAHGERRVLTLEEFEELVISFDNHLDARDSTVFSLYKEAKKLIEAATSKEEINKIDIKFNRE